MTSSAISGIPVALVAQWEAVGTPADPELPITLTIQPIAGGPAVLTTQAVARVTAGIFTYSWTPPAVESTTDYLVTWDPSGDDVAAVEVLQVFPAVSGTWVTAVAAKVYTGEDLTEEELARASSIIDIYSGMTVDQPEESISPRDRRWLGMATAYQAAWMKGKPGLLTHRESHRASSSDGVHTTREADSQIMLAPLAARTLKNLSWIAGRTVQHGAYPRAKGSIVDSDHHAWTGLAV